VKDIHQNSEINDKSKTKITVERYFYKLINRDNIQQTKSKSKKVANDVKSILDAITELKNWGKAVQHIKNNSFEMNSGARITKSSKIKPIDSKTAWPNLFYDYVPKKRDALEPLPLSSTSYSAGISPMKEIRGVPRMNQTGFYSHHSKSNVVSDAVWFSDL